MGVQGLWELLSPVGHRVSNDHVRNKVLAVDISIWLTQFVKAMRDAEGAQVRNGHLLGMFRRCLKLLFLSVRPVFVFDGGTPALKRRTLSLRHAQREKHAAKLRRLAEKLLLNNLKMHTIDNAIARNQRKSQSKEGGTRSGAVCPSESGKASMREEIPRGFAEDEEDEIQPAPPPATSRPVAYETQNVDTGTSSLNDVVGADNSDWSADEESEGEYPLVLPRNVADLDDDALVSLPPTVQAEVFKQIKHEQRLRHRENMHRRKEDPSEFSRTQIEGFLNHTALNCKIRRVRKVINSKSGASQRIASDSSRQFLLEDNIDIYEGNESDMSGSHDEFPNVSKKKASRSGDAEGPMDLLARIRAAKEAKQPMPRTGGPHSDIAKNGRQTRTVSGVGWASSVLEGKGGLSLLRRPNAILIQNDDISVHSASDTEQGSDTEEPVVIFHKPSEETVRDTKGTKDSDSVVQKITEDSSDDDVEWEDGSKPTEYDSGNDPDDAHNKERLLWHPETLRTEISPLRRQPSATYGVETSLDTEKKHDTPAQTSVSALQKCEEEKDHMKIDTSLIKNDSSKVERAFPMPTNRNACNFEVEETPASMLSLSPEGKAPENQGNELEREDASGLGLMEITEGRKPERLVNDATTQEVGDTSQNKSQDQKQKSVSFVVEEDIMNSYSGKTLGAHQLMQQNTTYTAAVKPSSSGEASTSEQKEDLASCLPRKNVAKSGNEELESISNEEPGLAVHTAQKKQHDSNAMSRSVPEEAHANVQDDRGVSHLLKDQASYRIVFPEDGDEITASTARESEDKASVGAPINSSGDNEAEDITGKSKANLSADSNKASLSEMQALQRELETEALEIRRQQKTHRGGMESVADEMYSETRDLIKLFGIPYMEAPMEAEAQCAFLNKEKIVDGVLTEDSDAFLFGAKTIYRHLFAEGQFAEAYEAKDIESNLALDRDNLIRLAYLLGSDYTPGVRGVGVVNSMEILEAFPGPNGLGSFREWTKQVTILDEEPEESILNGTSADAVRRRFCWKHRNMKRNWEVREGFPNPAVFSAYVNPEVNKRKDRFRWGTIDFEGLAQFCWDKFGWEKDRFENTVGPLRKQTRERSGKTQTRIDEFFKPHRFAKIRSQRLQSAVKGMAGDVSAELMATTRPLLGKRKSRPFSYSAVHSNIDEMAVRDDSDEERMKADFGSKE